MIWTMIATTPQIAQSTRSEACAIALAKKTQSQGNGGARYVFSDQFKFVHWRDAGVDQQKCDHQRRRQAKIRNKCRQPLKRLQHHESAPDHSGVIACAKRVRSDFNGSMTAWLASASDARHRSILLPPEPLRRATKPVSHRHR